MTSGDPLESGWRGSVADGYGFGDDELARLKEAAGWLAAFEDGLHPHRLVDLAINGAPGLDGDRLDGTPALLGARYAILADGFAGAGPATPREPMRKALVSFGYVDEADLCGRTLDALAGFNARMLEVTIAIGAAAPHLAALRRRAASSPHRVEIRLDADDMAELLGEADLAIGAGGVSLYERLAAGVPSITILAAENQRLIVEGVAAVGATLFLGAVGDVSAQEILEAVARLDRDRQERARLARAGRALIDGRGAERTAAALRAFAQERRR
jgi:spore coat polysaccharide biosynthesis predicted glycosyltransferase SpsG